MDRRQFLAAVAASSAGMAAPFVWRMASATVRASTSVPPPGG